MVKTIDHLAILMAMVLAVMAIWHRVSSIEWPKIQPSDLVSEVKNVVQSF